MAMAGEMDRQGGLPTSEQNYLLLVLADSNLPTGGFVASSGLESCWSHGLLRQGDAAAGLNGFLQSSLDSYSRSVAAFINDVHMITQDFVCGSDSDTGNGNGLDMQRAIAAIEMLDKTYSSTLLNHVAQRASRAQGIALLTLHAKSFARGMDEVSDVGRVRQQRSLQLLRNLKLRIRAGTLDGHLPTCFAAFMAALGIQDPTRVLEVHLFLQTRAILSSAVRLNIVGPYQMHRILAFDAKAIIDGAVRRSRTSTTGLLPANEPNVHRSDEPGSASHTTAKVLGGNGGVSKGIKGCDWDWDWQDQGSWSNPDPLSAPKTTWPLGDLIQARHDQLHSRLFNS